MNRVSREACIARIREISSTFVDFYQSFGENGIVELAKQVDVPTVTRHVCWRYNEHWKEVEIVSKVFSDEIPPDHFMKSKKFYHIRHMAPEQDQEVLKMLMSLRGVSASESLTLTGFILEARIFDEKLVGELEAFTTVIDPAISLTHWIGTVREQPANIQSIMVPVCAIITAVMNLRENRLHGIKYARDVLTKAKQDLTHIGEWNHWYYSGLLARFLQAITDTEERELVRNHFQNLLVN